MAAEDCLATSIKQNKVATPYLLLPLISIALHQLGKVIEDSEQEWPKEGRRQYHAISRQEDILRLFLFSQSSRGWIANEIFRRVHPEGATIG